MVNARAELITVPKSEYESLIEAVKIFSSRAFLNELSESEKRIKSGKFVSLNDL